MNFEQVGQLHALRRFMECYFHQDWDLQGHDSGEVVRSVKKDLSREERDGLVGDLKILLAFDASEEELADAMVVLGSDVVPSMGGSSNRAWLEAMLEALEPR